MPRRKCCRQIGGVPDASYYSPGRDSDQSCGEVVLNLDEFEAIRLADFAGLYQEDAAGRMNISRQTFGRIIAEKVTGGEVSPIGKRSIGGMLL